MTGKPSLKGLAGRRRKAVSVSSQELVREEPLSPDHKLPLVIRPAMDGVDLGAWAAGHREEIQAKLLTHGGLLFRGFDLPNVDRFQSTVRAISGNLLEYKERSSPRHTVGDKVYTSTDYPPSEPIFLHNENSYQNAWPMKIFFFCDVEPEGGGETPIADVRQVYSKIDPQVRELFAQKRWMYVRNFGDGFGLPWQTVFQTEDRARVEEHCANAGIELEWKEEDRLRARAVRPAISRHPTSGETVWFNHATFFHVSTLTEGVRRALLAEFGEEDLPTNTFFGDGTPIPSDVLEHLREVYESETIRFPWRQGDLLMLDNMLVAHGRAPFTGARKILVAMADPMTWDRMPS